MYLFADNMIVYAENLRELTKQLLELIIFNYSRFSRNKVSSQKSIAFLYTSNELLEFKIKNTFPFTLASKKRGTFNVMNWIYVSPKFISWSL